MFDFGMLPPEVNSARMYSGSGSGPLMAAAAAWDALTSQLDSFVAGYSSAIAELHGHSWAGPASEAMLAAAAPFVAWATETATLTGQAANQARAAAAAYEIAFAATVPPEVVAANRTQLAVLVATNFFGQNSAMIAANEAAYAAMWAQDAAAMYGYAAASATASELAPFQQPPQTTNPVGQPVQSVVMQSATTGASHATPSASDAFINDVSSFNTLIGPVRIAGQLSRVVGSMGSFVTAARDAVGASAASAPQVGTAAEFQPAAAGVRGAVLASVGQAEPVGKLSAPPSWTAATSAAEPAQPALRLAGADARSLGTANPGMRGGVPPIGMAPGAGGSPYRKGNLVFRMRDRRFYMPRPAVGG